MSSVGFGDCAGTETEPSDNRPRSPIVLKQLVDLSISNRHLICKLADFSDQIVDGLPYHRPALAQEEVARTRITALLAFLQPGAQSAQLIAFHRLLRRRFPFLPAYLKASGLYIQEVGVDAQHWIGQQARRQDASFGYDQIAAFGQQANVLLNCFPKSSSLTQGSNSSHSGIDSSRSNTGSITLWYRAEGYD